MATFLGDLLVRQIYYIFPMVFGNYLVELHFFMLHGFKTVNELFCIFDFDKLNYFNTNLTLMTNICCTAYILKEYG